MLTIEKSYGIVQRILLRLEARKMANLQTLSPRERAGKSR
jgi:hypothetical protein